MFGFDFYPTPPAVIQDIINGHDFNGKTVLEPSAGKGNLVDALTEQGARVVACEIDEDLCKILQSKCEIVGHDFLALTSDKVSHVDFIVMNPPFSKGVEHILHAWQIAPEGCTIIALCNSQTIKNPYSKSREELKHLIETVGDSVALGDVFSKAERQTDVEVSLLRLYKPGENKNEFDGFYMEDEPEEQTGAGLIPFNVVRELVNRYVEALRIFDLQLETAEKLNDMVGTFFKGSIGLMVTHSDKPLRRNEFKKGLQKEGWSYIFSKLNMEKYATTKLQEDINKFVEKQDHIPFTMRNIYKMLEIVVGTNGSRMDRALLDVFDRVTRHHDDNKYGLEGWKTNSHYLLTRRFIMPNIIRCDYNGRPEITHHSNQYEIVNDLMKALCYLTGEDYANVGDIWHAIRYGEVINLKNESKAKIEWGKWFEWAFFKIRVYKKGTVHFEFKDEKVWASFNQRIAKLKGYPLPEKRPETAYQARQNGHTYKVKPVILETIKI